MIAIHQNKISLGKEQKSALLSLLYFDIFTYPLTEKEISEFSPVPFSSEKNTLEQLVSQNLIYKVGGFYSLRPDEQLSERRIKGNELAEIRMKNARKYSRWVASFPFVRAVMLSGSISKGFMDEQSDIDYFIITAPDRLWIVRAALAVFRRLFLFNSHKNLCTNYFIDTNNLSIPDRNYFTAIEFCTLVPMYGSETIESFRLSNQWVNSYLPSCRLKHLNLNDRNSKTKEFIEKIFFKNLSTRLNQLLMEFTLKYWKKKYAGPLNDSDFEVAFRSKPGVSKSHPQFFQKKVLDRLSQKVKQFEEEHGVDLSL